ncbi:hypothetical protein [Streptomyces sp. NPDC051016]|uniref:hypothetical protein n=1 Tax=Streptomyces sp. NPDC051016 TaxID=3365638 RepID=UPI0037876246
MTTIEIAFELPSRRLPLPLKERDAFAAALRQHPDEWALMGHHWSSGSARQAAYAIRKGQTPCFAPSGTFEADAKTVIGEHRVYVRYLSHRAEGASSEVTGR